MKNKWEIQQEVEKTLDSLEGIKRAEANPFLFTRIQAALQRKPAGSWGRVVGFMARPMVALVTILIVLAINMAVFFTSKTQPSEEEQQLYASEYFSNSSMTDFEISPNE